jgi:MYXO-CTERM domain-containing protein
VSRPRCLPVVSLVLPLLGAVLVPGLARAERWVSAFDPAQHVRPPTMKATDGRAAPLVVDADFLARAAAFRRANPGFLRQSGAVVQQGEVAIVEGTSDLVDTEGTRYSVRLGAVARKVIEKYGDHFQAMTLWLTFNEASSTQAEAYEFTVRADVRGLGQTLRDNSPAFGSKGTLRSLLNMKRVWSRVNDDRLESWLPHLETWGQESGHRWMVFMKFRDRRDGSMSDAMLGRACSHYNRFLDSGASVHDGYDWKDNGNGSFTADERFGYRFGDLDLYGMGLLAADELPPFFLIDELPGYKHVPCGAYETTPGRPLGRTVQGTRVDIGIDDIVAANGRRIPSSDELLEGKPQDYFREVQVVLTRPDETAQDPLPQMIAQRVDKARVLWESWMREATSNRMVVCTRLSADCGDARSDVTGLSFNAARKNPTAGPVAMEVAISNPGSLAASEVKASLETVVDGKPKLAEQTVGALAPGASRTVSFEVDTRGMACGTELSVKAVTQSSTHRHRRKQSFLVGAESLVTEGFEADAGWVVNPDGSDTTAGAIWERGTPEQSAIENGSPVQPQGARSGTAAFVTGAAALGGPRATFVYGGRSTLESPAFDASAWRDARLRYWVSFAGMQANPLAGGVVPSPNSRLIVQGRLQDQSSAGGDGGVAGADAAGTVAGSGDWVEIERLENQITDGWVHRTVALPVALAGGRVKLRFVAEDANPQSGGVEAAIDDVEITSNLPACYQAAPGGGGGGGGCAVGGGGRAGGAGALTLLLLALLGLRRRPGPTPPAPA